MMWSKMAAACAVASPGRRRQALSTPVAGSLAGAVAVGADSGAPRRHHRPVEEPPRSRPSLCRCATPLSAFGHLHVIAPAVNDPQQARTHPCLRRPGTPRTLHAAGSPSTPPPPPGPPRA
ncbi:Os03g0617300 [Oryza sativa Japonica Group]|uniref:Os03g0617300 protein n=1 Tax=Oryza sativa subsp. japonica TaxID=39947 RepID=A0A0N7KHN1_ORYSJ|nr:Os03g0617300 [Oryza sativa Japonica Group]